MASNSQDQYHPEYSPNQQQYYNQNQYFDQGAYMSTQQHQGYYYSAPGFSDASVGYGPAYYNQQNQWEPDYYYGEQFYENSNPNPPRRGSHRGYQNNRPQNQQQFGLASQSFSAGGANKKESDSQRGSQNLNNPQIDSTEQNYHDTDRGERDRGHYSRGNMNKRSGYRSNNQNYEQRPRGGYRGRGRGQFSQDRAQRGSDYGDRSELLGREEVNYSRTCRYDDNCAYELSDRNGDRRRGNARFVNQRNFEERNVSQDKARYKDPHGDDFLSRNAKQNKSVPSRGEDKWEQYVTDEMSDVEPYNTATRQALMKSDATEKVNERNQNSGARLTVLAKDAVMRQDGGRFSGVPDSTISVANRQQKKKIEKKEDLGQRGSLIEQFQEASYECMVCCSNIRCEAAIWSCNNCYHSFHLYCVKKWARSSTAAVQGDAGGWRCPVCQNVTQTIPNRYMCFCGKIQDPVWDRFETPHTCGEMCSKKRADDCTHPCNILCHPGPCPSCEARVNKPCLCGRVKQFVKCSQAQGMRCSKACQKTLNCGKHECKIVCHAGSCEPCDVIISQACFGSHSSRDIICGTKESFKKSFSCGVSCAKVLDCTNHFCDSVCHEGPCDGCKLLPSAVTHCPCGKSELTDLGDKPRMSCLDPVSTCEKMCEKSLPCGPKDSSPSHQCQRRCHDGECGPCDDVTEMTCRCGAVTREVPCTEAMKYSDSEPYKCNKRCSKKRTCGRHKCNKNCCIDADHICEQVCGRRLPCGLHRCEELCHRGNCPPCLMASFDELPCHCGAEVMFPPIPCGARPPECHRLCARTHSCNHAVVHSCHSDAECPPCTVLTIKWCMGQHEIRKNIMCYVQDVSCGLPCNKPLQCIQHLCIRTCHKGDCLEDGQACTQPCKVERAECGHPCGAPCHDNSPCPSSACKAQILIKCPCGNRSSRMVCNLGNSENQETIAEYQRIATVTLANSLKGLQLGQSVDISKLNPARKLNTNTRHLDCDAECAMLERNKRVALALEIRNPDLSAKLGNPPYSQFLKDFAKQNPQFVASVEKNLAELVQSAKKSKQKFRSHIFPPGNSVKRRVVYELSELYGCQTESYDYEPQKNVVAIAHRDKCWLPSVSLTTYIQRAIQPKAPLPIPHRSNAAEIRDLGREARQSTEVYVEKKRLEASAKPKPAPVIDYFDFTN